MGVLIADAPHPQLKDLPGIPGRSFVSIGREQRLPLGKIRK